MHREHARFDWVIGCDGLHSTVRTKLGLPFQGSDYEQMLALADLRLDWELPDNEAHALLSPEGSLMFEPVPGGLFRLAPMRFIEIVGQTLV